MYNILHPLDRILLGVKYMTKKSGIKAIKNWLKNMFSKTKSRVVVFRLIGFVVLFVLIGVLIYRGLSIDLFSGNDEEPLIIEETTLEEFQDQEALKVDLNQTPLTKADEGAPDLVQFEKEDTEMVQNNLPNKSTTVTADAGKVEEQAGTCKVNGDVREVTEGVKPVAFSVWELLQPIEGEILTPFGWHRHPVLGNWKFHRGVDIKAPVGVPIKAAFAGKVLKVSQDDYYGLRVEIKHDTGFRTVYAQLAEVRVQVGDSLTQGQIIGTVGQTGLVTTPHLHFEVIEGNEPVDPLKYLKVKH